MANRKSSSRSKGKATRKPELVPQLEALLKRLRRRHPDLLGIGLGYRRRRGRIVPETVVKFQVPRKIKKVKGFRPLPEHVRLKTLALGQVVSVLVPTDVETPRRMKPTAATADGMTVSALAAWVGDGGATCVGIITAAHGLGNAPVDVLLKDGSKAQGRVVARSSLNDGYDVGLVQLDVTLDRLPDLGPIAPRQASADELLAMLSSDPGDLMSTAAASWCSDPPKSIQALAFFIEWRWRGLDFTMKRVVQCSGGVNDFEPGSSGAVWVTTPPDPIVLALQSHAHEPIFDLAEGTHFRTCVEWLTAQPGIKDLRVAWRPADLRNAG